MVYLHIWQLTILIKSSLFPITLTLVACSINYDTYPFPNFSNNLIKFTVISNYIILPQNDLKYLRN